MNFDFDDDQRDIRRTARDMLAARVRPERLRELAEAARDDDELWREVIELGWPGIAVSEQYGGQGLGLVELVILQEELGYALASVPLLSSAAAALVIEAAGSPEQRARWLPRLVAGELRAALAVAPTGSSELVPDAAQADLLVFVERGRVRMLQAGQAQISPVESLDATRRFAAVRDAQEGEALPGDPHAALWSVAVATAAESVGVAQRVMEMAVGYAKERRQFGQPIGVHQAVSHRCVQMLLETESARSAVLFAAWAGDHEPETLPLAAASAKAYASDAGWRVAASALQVLGGIGFTWEHDLHFFFKRARANAQLYGSARQYRDAVAAMICD